MALKKIIQIEGASILQTQFGNVNTGSSFVSVAPYICVVSINGNKSSAQATVRYVDGTLTFQKNFTIPLSVADGSPNFIRQAYLHLKTLPEFAGAEDC